MANRNDRRPKKPAEAAPAQGGGFVTESGDGSWAHQDPDTWARLGKPQAEAAQPASESRQRRAPRPARGTTGGEPRDTAWMDQDPDSWAALGRGQGETAAAPMRVQRNEPLPNSEPEPAEPQKKPMQIISLDGPGSKLPGQGAKGHQVEMVATEQQDKVWFKGRPPIRIVRRSSSSASVGRIVFAVVFFAMVGGLAWREYEAALATEHHNPANAIIYTKLERSSALEEVEEPDPAAATGQEPKGLVVGTLTVRTDREATVYVDGRTVGAAPLEGSRIIPGPHEVRVVDEATLDSRSRLVEIEPGQPTVLVVTFDR